MGRKKIKMEMIPNQKSRILCFKKRRDGLMKKVQELITLCDVPACCIIYGPTQDESAVIWPPYPHEVRRVIGVYKSQLKNNRCKSSGVSDFLNEKIKKADEEVIKLRKSKYPCWNEMLDSTRDPLVLRGFADELKNKMHTVKSRIDLLKTQEFMKLNQNQEINGVFVDDGVDIEALFVDQQPYMHLLTAASPSADPYPIMDDEEIEHLLQAFWEECENHGDWQLPSMDGKLNYTTLSAE